MADALLQQIREIYRAVEAGDLDTIATHIAPDGFGMSGEANGIFIGREPLASELSGWLERTRPGSGLRLESTDLRVSLSASGRSGWLWDQLRIGRAGEDADIVVRITALVGLQGSTWQIIAAHWSVPISNERTKALLKEGRLLIGRQLDDDARPGAESLMRALDAGIKEITTYPALYSTADEQVTIGSAVEEIFRGAAARTGWQEFVGWGPKLSRRGGVRGGLTPDGMLGWLATHIDITFDLTTPYRFFYIWRLDGTEWNVIASHDSVSVDPR